MLSQRKPQPKADGQGPTTRTIHLPRFFVRLPLSQSTRENITTFDCWKRWAASGLLHKPASPANPTIRCPPPLRRLVVAVIFWTTRVVVVSRLLYELFVTLASFLFLLASLSDSARYARVSASTPVPSSSISTALASSQARTIRFSQRQGHLRGCFHR